MQRSYYTKPDTINGYVHDNVVLGYLGTAYGDATDIPATLIAGQTVTKDFSVDLSEFTVSQNTDNIWVVGLAQTGKIGYVENAISSGKDFPTRTPIRVQTSDEVFLTNESDSPAVTTFEFRNTSGYPLNIDYETQIFHHNQLGYQNNWTAASNAPVTNLGQNETGIVICNLKTEKSSRMFPICLWVTIKKQTKCYNCKLL